MTGTAGQAALHALFGLYWQASPPLPGLPVLADSPQVDLRVWLDQRPDWLLALLKAPQAAWYISPFQGTDGTPVVTGWRLADGRHLRLASDAGNEMIVDSMGEQIWLCGSSPRLMDAWYSWMIGLVLRLRGCLCLHASAVVVDGAVCVLVGPEQSGKSTLAAALSRRGCPVLADDLVVLSMGGTMGSSMGGAMGNAMSGTMSSALRNDRAMVQPGLPWLRLRPSASTLLDLGDAAPLPLVETEGGDYLDLRACDVPAAFQGRPAPLGGLWFLGPPRDDGQPSAIRPYPARAAFHALLGRTWATRLLDKAQRAAEMDQLACLLSRVSPRAVSVAATSKGLDALCTDLIADARIQQGATARAA